jgi:hypothetical protein
MAIVGFSPAGSIEVAFQQIIEQEDRSAGFRQPAFGLQSNAESSV